MSENNNLEGINGWLILVAIGIIITPIRSAYVLIPTYTEIFTTNVWAALTSPAYESYNALWAPILIGELIINSLIICSWLYMGYLFFTKKASMPKWYIGIAFFSLLFIIADAYSISLVMPSEPVFNPDTIKELGRALIMVCIWVPYMLVSKRVKATFVN